MSNIGVYEIFTTNKWQKWWEIACPTFFMPSSIINDDARVERGVEKMLDSTTTGKED